MTGVLPRFGDLYLTEFLLFLSCADHRLCRTEDLLEKLLSDTFQVVGDVARGIHQERA